MRTLKMRGRNEGIGIEFRSREEEKAMPAEESE